VLEAMARGLPVACSNTGSLPEVAGGAALLFDPESPAAIASAIETLLADRNEASRLVGLGYDRAAQLTWQKTARATADVYRRTLGLDSSA
jgi:alpha-1,3-rhamnosyl/mannosyltransferase